MTPGVVVEPAFLSVKQLCARYAVSRTTFYRMLADERSGLRALVVRIPPPYGRLRIPVLEFESWLRRRQAG